MPHIGSGRAMRVPLTIGIDVPSFSFNAGMGVLIFAIAKFVLGRPMFVQRAN
jgi:hypothetical protein